ncbi:LLM class F420-dependent oxidoreductase [Geodermatophilus sp. DF01-2]|uniref:LLM class F420-dependent oxidoreductase n=1 Tax=Geodermatophilus sp. DF01-2 TaxID=2559610 RepID=UPI001073B3DF|nr:LLM class F420-dependent oxidoreductase [Geodermatophilus sp. DF01_2]TFV64315.1 LLM class F420-dependent oxidoreductase [Geodermatophilus sp. DF01_2]
MQIGIVSPVVTLVPGAHSEWERTGGIEDLGRIAEVADRLGFAHLTCSEHVAVPTDVAQNRGATYWDPLATFGHLAARTRRVRFATQVLVVGYHHPLEIAKRYGTLDRVSGGRLTLGLGVGSLEEEFDLLGVPFSGRGPRADDAIAALRAALSQREPSYTGEFYDFSGFVVEPHAQQGRVPLWIGGRTLKSLRRAVTVGDGWVPFGLSFDELADLLGAVDVPAGFEVVLSAGRSLDPIGNPDRTREALARPRAAGATTVNVALAADSADHYCAQLEALAQLAADDAVPAA